VRHEVARDPIVGVVQEDFQYFPDFSGAGKARASKCGSVRSGSILHHLLLVAIGIVSADREARSKVVTGLAPLYQQGIGGLA
jgi:hypothetical protein